MKRLILLPLLLCSPCFAQNCDYSQIDGVTMWLDASDLQTLTVDAVGAVSQWDSKVGSISFTQGTAANQPTRTSGSGLENLLPTSNEFDNTTYWDLASDPVSATQNQTDPFGASNTAYTITATAGSDLHRLIVKNGYRPYEVAGESYILSVYLKYSNYANVWIGTESATWDGCSVDLSAGTVSDCNNATATIESVGSGWYRLSLVRSFAASGNPIVEVGFDGNQTASDGTTSFGAVGTEEFYVAHLQFRHANSSPQYVATTTQPVYRGGSTGLSGIRFDGVDDKMTSTSQLSDLFTAGAKTVIAVGRASDLVSHNSYILTGVPNVKWIGPLFSTTGPSLRCYNDDGGGDGVNSGQTPVTNATYFIACVHDGTNLKTFSNTNNASTASGDTSSLTDTLELGYTAGGHVIAGDLYELVTFNRVLESAERAQITNCMQQKWGGR